MKKANNQDLEKILEYIGKDYGKCLYLYLDIKEYGLENENIHLWYSEKNEEIVVIAMKYYSGMHIFSRNMEFNRNEIKELISKEKPDMVCSMGETADYINFIPEGYARQDGIIVKINRVEEKKYEEVSVATIDDVAGICNLLKDDEKLGKPFGYDVLYAQFKERIEKGFGRSWILKENGIIKAHNSSNAEGFGVAVSGGWVADPTSRGKGFGGKVLYDSLVGMGEGGKEVFTYLYEDNAIRGVERIGMTELGIWSKIYKI